MSTPSMPFEVSRQNRASLIEQVADGLRSAILAGHYRAGDTLPNLHEMAAALGVSEIVTRHAVRRLSGEGLLNPRRGTGIVVCGDELKTWRGHVLYIHWSGSNMYYHNLLCGVMVERLHAAGMLVSTLHVSGADYEDGFVRVQAELGHVVSLAVIEGPAERLDALLGGRGIPFLHLHEQGSPLAAQRISPLREPVLAAMREHCLACGIRTLVHVYSISNPTPNFQARFASLPVVVDSLPITPTPGVDSPESVQRGALAGMLEWLAAKPQLPDAFWFADDYVAAGALLALTARGVRVPDDVQVISWANKGLGPVFLKPLTRVEMDPKAHGEIVARRILDRLENKPPAETAATLSPTFIVGETTRGAKRVE